MRYFLPIISGLVTAVILAPKYFKINTLDDFVEYTNFTTKFLIILSFLGISVIFVWVVLNKRYEEGILMFRDIGISIISSFLATGIIWFFGFRKLPDEISKQINIAMSSFNNNVNDNTNNNKVSLSQEHLRILQKHTEIKNDLSKEHYEIKNDLKDLVADMNRRQGNNADSKNILELTNIIQSTVIKQDERILKLTKRVDDLLKENANLEAKLNNDIELKIKCDELTLELKNCNKKIADLIEEKTEIENKNENLAKRINLMSSKLEKYENQTKEPSQIKNKSLER